MDDQHCWKNSNVKTKLELSHRVKKDSRPKYKNKGGGGKRIAPLKMRKTEDKIGGKMICAKLEARSWAMKIFLSFHVK